jgi:hypothetical protein
MINKIYKKDKKGVSDVITTVLIILLVLAAVAIIGGILLRNISQAGSKIETSTGCVELDIQPVSCTLTGSGAATAASVIVQRGSRGSNLDISKLAAVVEKSDGTTATGYATTANINPLATTTISVPAVGANAKNARVAATLRGSDGSEQTCELTNVVAECKTAPAPPTQYSLTVTKQGAGAGTVTSTPSGINCGTGGTDCNENYNSGTSVTLTASASSGSSFYAWTGGGCVGSSATCTVTMDANKAVTATFNLQSS